MSNKLRIAFMGTPDFSVNALQRLIESQHEIVCVYTQPPRPKGRGQKLKKSPVYICAENLDIDVRHPINFKDKNDIEDFKKLNLDLAIVAAYGLILPESILNVPKYGCINIHASLLPRWRGAAPIQRSIMAGDEKSGVTIMQMDKGLDTGAEILKKSIDMNDKTTAQELHDDLSLLGSDMIIGVIDELSKNGKLNSTPQSEEGITYAHMLQKAEGKIDFNETSIEIDRKIRALNPFPGTWCLTQNGKRLKVLKADILDSNFEGSIGKIVGDGKVACGNKSVLQLVKVQPENKKPMDIQAALNGGYLKVGDIIS